MSAFFGRNLNFLIAGEKPHECDICHKRFSSTSNLKTHLRLHSGQKPYACDLCPAKFTQFVHLKLHKRLHNNERPYNCNACGKKYISASGLRTHWKTTSCRPKTEDDHAIERRTPPINLKSPDYMDGSSEDGSGGGEFDLREFEEKKFCKTDHCPFSEMIDVESHDEGSPKGVHVDLDLSPHINIDLNLHHDRDRDRDVASTQNIIQCK